MQPRSRPSPFGANLVQVTNNGLHVTKQNKSPVLATKRLFQQGACTVHGAVRHSALGRVDAVMGRCQGRVENTEVPRTKSLQRRPATAPADA